MEVIFSLTTKMKEVEIRFPFARSLLHSKFHVGGCSKCGYEPHETIAEVAQKHNKDPESMVVALNKGVEEMTLSELTPAEFHKLLNSKNTQLIIDVREQWEYEIAHIPNSILLSESNFEDIIQKSKAVDMTVVVCHHGLRSMNATLYLREKGIENARSLKGGIDLYSATIDNSIPRY